MKIHFSLLYAHSKEAEMIDAKKYTDDPALSREYLRFLQLKFITDDFEATKLLPSLEVNTIWQRHILDTKAYTNDCMTMFGNMIHHNIERGGDEIALLDQQYRKTLVVYEQIFNEEAPVSYWPKRFYRGGGDKRAFIFRLDVLHLVGEEKRVKVQNKRVIGSMTVRELKEELHKDDNFAPVEDQRMIVRGRQLNDTERLFDTCLDENGRPLRVFVLCGMWIE